MSVVPDWISRVPVLRAQPARRQERYVEVLRFCIVGGMNWLVDLGVFNLMRWLLPLRFVLVAKIIAAAVATVFSWGVNRQWTFRVRATEKKAREFFTFILVNVAGLIPPLLCLTVSHHVLGFSSALADNISANVIGLFLGTVLRYFGYRYLVFTRRHNDAAHSSPSHGQPRRTASETPRQK